MRNNFMRFDGQTEKINTNLMESYVAMYIDRTLVLALKLSLPL